MKPRLRNASKASCLSFTGIRKTRLYVSLLTIVLPLVMFASAALTWSSLQWAAYILIATGAILFLPYGGQRTLVTRRDIAVRWGAARL